VQVDVHPVRAAQTRLAGYALSPGVHRRREHPVAGADPDEARDDGQAQSHGLSPVSVARMSSSTCRSASWQGYFASVWDAYLSYAKLVMTRSLCGSPRHSCLGRFS